MIRKLLYRFRRMVLVRRLSRLKYNRMIADRRYHENHLSLLVRIEMTSVMITKLDATEMSKGEAYVVVR